jgi:hypothetical protein
MIKSSVTHSGERRMRFDDVKKPQVEKAARQCLTEECPYAFYFREVRCEFTEGVLRVQGRVPTYYLKQILQSRLATIAGVRWVDNQVDVVSSVGLSTVRAK